ncbi:Arc family DNA-binding protein [Kerstersia gyiorum]|uniref:Arc family DNA-binding protein n=1 Tax=Kerstersia gyiorum TaxID=206506 RepID=UPI0027E28C71|nr:Arc family DNA-binding protein [Kerstersia gyiorum]
MMKKYQMASTIRRMSKPLPPSRTAPQFVVRFPDESMRDRIAEAAKANNRSMNAEIIARLEHSFNAALQESAHSVSEKALEAASERGAQKAVEKLLRPLEVLQTIAGEPSDGSASRDYLERALRIIVGSESSREPPSLPESRSGTPKIPGVNAPKRGLGAAPKSTQAEENPAENVTPRKKKINLVREERDATDTAPTLEQTKRF